VKSPRFPLWLALPLLFVWADVFPLNAQDGVEKATFERLILRQLNRARTDPKGYADYMVARRAFYQSNRILSRPGELPIQTKEGIAAVDEAINVLRALPPLMALATSEPLTQTAREFAAEQARSGGFGHSSRSSGDLSTRLSLRGVWLPPAGENIAYGSTTPERIVFDLIVDDGQSRREHRANILNGDFRVVGIGFDLHPTYRAVCIMEFAGGYTAR
jgi:uncharacterized protein YkwD